MTWKDGYERVRDILFRERDENNQRVKSLEAQIRLKDRQLVELAHSNAEYQAAHGMAQIRFADLQERIEKLEGQQHG